MESRKLTILDRYFRAWALVIPVTSVLVVPGIQGTIPGYIFSFLLIFALLVCKLDSSKINTFKDMFVFTYIFIIMILISQLINGTINIPSLERVILVNKLDINTEIFRGSLFTQSLYLIPCIILFCFIKNYYSKDWDKYIFWGIGIYAIFGLYEFFYYIIFNEFGDFLTNRNFGEHETIRLGNQLMTIAGFTFQRINGLALEPSMFAFTVLPFWIYSIHTKRKRLSLILLCSLLLTASTTAFIGIILYYCYAILKSNQLRNFFIFTFGLLVILLFWDYVYAILDKTIFQKMFMKTESGIDRSNFFMEHLSYFQDSSFLTKLFGIGFGYVRSTDFFTTILVNNGIVGFCLFSLLFAYPLFTLKNSYKNMGIKMALVVIYTTMMVSIPEFSFLSTWLFLGIAYKEVFNQNKVYIESNIEKNKRNKMEELK
ncbi:hypothetical protein MRY88_26280 [Bacillus cereus]|uniref:Putative membrane protein n=1 Tax=Bacillus cereus (strain 03BB102) TaxID=572264 RepID=A0A158RJV7_BACC3|nr:hypothetical protein [Bacillus cereus]ACO27347.1 putative membrane protein [Bacillus cereus 03BB102]AEW58378.1 Hypothetical protein bcf_26425 [Bacillus cereus F837/76]AJG52494.1 O-antigen ligase like membrane family protein [Bacillus cereus 03BB102]EEK53692.1 hypothetical protein bcere0004_50270 [Bacillus cereus BGSC 6E1]MCU9552033.1 hypothetical protein [Bacillus cereus]